MTNPFSMGGIDKLQEARKKGDVAYIESWTHQAILWHAKEKQLLYEKIEELIKELAIYKTAEAIQSSTQKVNEDG